MSNVWWVNQSTRKGSPQNKIIWAPHKNKGNKNVPHWDSLLEANVGDTVFHYTNGYIVGMSKVIEKAEDSINPYSGNEQWDKYGKKLPIEFVKPIHKAQIPLNIRIQDKSVFDKNGNVKQGYFFLIGTELDRKLKSLMSI
ncbi:hypothetical protein HT665_06255 [Ursidibacter maritimus]|uniref:EVE domain-containing protein n=1 Tax=Ursidibacter maritimus TaxID=1331689 RepID=A0A949WM29_9PAST|nr:hypothetical protein [Ursidibacter maritimus]KAE9540269.1 hypothetical protein A1D26_00885 [Ursidibacter maritimus]MBV6524786.1 hypothetical protein [Ursidibacter maritimus]MBV6525650.1 hypothetical protein [Ursidibacter maritimus]MBV6528139.1 hypothetical protein [Ursidibacter maritimus]MBV6528959.1 hypothetical protein [Ursidibacter maritimus]